MERMIAGSVTAVIGLSYVAAPAFAARGRGTIINIASIAAIAPELLNGACGGTKTLALAFSRSLKKDLDGNGVDVQAGPPPSNFLADRMMTPEVLADLEAGRFASIPSLQDESQWKAACKEILPTCRHVRRGPAARWLRVEGMGGA